jgi:outer membrane protein OmpA-like peptidoglycan-associated protein
LEKPKENFVSLKTLVLATALATTLPGVASAVSMSCDDPGNRGYAPYANSLGRGFPSYRRPALPEWVKERRSQAFERYAPRMSPIERPKMPDWVRERREHIAARPQRPELPDWVQARRSARPTLSSGYGVPRFGRSLATTQESVPTPEQGAVSNPVLPHQFGAGHLPAWGRPGFAGPVGYPGWGGPAWGAPGWGGPGWGGPFGGYGPMSGLGDMLGDMDFSIGIHARGDAASRLAGYGYRYPWPLLPPVAPAPSAAAQPAEKVAKVEAAPKPAPKPAPVDTDKDGVFNPSDLCPDSAPGAKVDAFGCEQNAAIVLRGVNFKTDSAELTSESLAILDGVSDTLVANPDIKVEVAGHTDSDGDDAYNKDLSQRRSESVVAYLSGKGVKAENMTAKGYGEEQPIAGNDTAAGKAQNRRVELNRL